MTLLINDAHVIYWRDLAPDNAVDYLDLVLSRFRFLPRGNGTCDELVRPNEDASGHFFLPKPAQAKFQISWGAGYDVTASGLKVGVDANLDPGGAIELTPKIGMGFWDWKQAGPATNFVNAQGAQPEVDRSEPIRDPDRSGGDPGIRRDWKHQYEGDRESGDPYAL